MKNAILGKYVSIRTGKLDVNESSIDGKYPFFTCARKPYRINRFAYDCECVLVAGNGDLNVKYFDGRFNAYQRTYIIESRDKLKLNVRYLYHFMNQYVDYLRQGSIGGVIKYIKLGHLTEAKFPCPPIEEQKRIAAILDKADAIRQKRKEAIKLTEELLRSTFLEMFGDPVTNPKGWPVKPLGDVLDFLTSGSRGWAKYYSSSGAVFLRIQNIRNGKLLLDDVAYVDPPKGAESVRTKVQAGDVLLSITADLGRTAVIPSDLGDAHINQHLAILRPIVEKVRPVFLSTFLESAGGLRQFNRFNKGGVKAGLNFSDLRSTKVILPPLDLQCEFEAAIKQADILSHKCEISLGQSETLFKALVQKAFNGEQ